MDPRFLQLYSEELAHLRDGGQEFAAHFPKIAARLGMHATEVDDPYVERLMEAFAFLTARVQLRLQEEFPRFSAQLLQRISPNFTAPVPSMGVVSVQPDLSDPALVHGFHLPAGQVLQSQISQGQQTPCKFRVAQGVTMWPLNVAGVQYGAVQQGFAGSAGFVPKAQITIDLMCSGAAGLKNLPIKQLDFYLSLPDGLAFWLLDSLFGGRTAIAARGHAGQPWQIVSGATLEHIGFSDEDALLPVDSGQFSGHRLLRELMACPERFLFVRLGGVSKAMELAEGQTMQFSLLLEHYEPKWDRLIGRDSLQLHCLPVVNLFEHRCDRVPVENNLHDLHVIPSRTRPQDYEVYSVLGVQAHGNTTQVSLEPLLHAQALASKAVCQYTTLREPSRLSSKAMQMGTRSGYQGSDVFLGLSRSHEALTEQHALQQLSVLALCTNRDLPLLMPIGKGTSDLHWGGNAPITAIRFLKAPSAPQAALAHGRATWQLIEHLHMNYLGLIETRQADPAHMLNQLFGAYADPNSRAHRELLGFIKTVSSRRCARQILVGGRPAVVRGLQVRVVLDQNKLHGLGCVLPGRVLQQLVCRHVSLNSFVELRVCADQTGHEYPFAALAGDRPLV